MDEEDEEFCPECGNYSDECGCKEEWEQELPDSEKGISHDPKLTLFIEGLFFWLLDRMPRDILEDYASKCLEMYDMDTARDILADCGMLRQESRF